MTDIRPFRCIRPAKQYASRVAALPYDVYNRAEAARAAAADPLSFLNIDRPETQFGADQDMYAPEVYREANRMLQQQIQNGIFEQDEIPGYGLYEQTMDGRTQTGLVACASIDDYLENRIRRHENTRAEKEADRIHHVDVCSMQTGPIFLAYRKNAQMEEIVRAVKQEQPVFDFVSEDGIRHRGWQIHRQERVQRIQALFSDINEIYIADGHHRAASAVKVGLKRRAAHPGYTGKEEFNYFLSVLFPDEELKIYDYNRVIRDLNGLSEQEFLQKVEEIFEIHSCEKTENSLPSIRPGQKGEMLMYLGRNWYQLTVRKPYRSNDPVLGLDVSILQEHLLHPVLGIGDPREDDRIDFVGGIRGLEELVRRVHTDCAVAFAMYPTSIGELFSVADAGLLMPPKSTWFEPKLRSGLYLHPIER